MSLFDPDTLGEKADHVDRHLERVAEMLPEDPAQLTAASAASDAVILHLWQAVQIVLDLATAACVRLGTGSPPTYGEAFRLLERAGILEAELAERLVRAAGFRNAVAHAYHDLDLERIWHAARVGPDDLRAFLARMYDLGSEGRPVR